MPECQDLVRLCIINPNNVMCETDISYQVPTPFDHQFYDSHHGLDVFEGTNLRWIKKRIFQLEHIERNEEQQKELEAKRVEIGLTRSGDKKPGVCWDFVSFQKCKHTSHQTDGEIIGGRWHPGPQEREHLQNINKNGRRRNAADHIKHRQNLETDMKRQLNDSRYKR